MFEAISQDLRHGARMLAKSHGFAFIAIVSIAIGVGANAAMFSIADGLILRPLPVARPGEIVAVAATTPTGDVEVDSVSYPDYVDVRDRAQSFDGLSADRGIVASFSRRRDEPASSNFGLAVSGNLLAAGARPSSVLRLVLRHGWLPAGCGVVVGVIVSAAAAGVIRSALTGSGIDIGTYLLVVPVVFAAVMIAAYIPARRAARLDPLAALRES